MLKLFLDDVRTPWDAMSFDPDEVASLKKEYVVCRTVEEAQKAILEQGPFESWSLDYDLRCSLTGEDLLVWLFEQENWKDLWPHKMVGVHSWHPVGEKRMRDLVRKIDVAYSAELVFQGFTLKISKMGDGSIEILKTDFLPEQCDATMKEVGIALIIIKPKELDGCDLEEVSEWFSGEGMPLELVDLARLVKHLESCSLKSS